MPIIAGLSDKKASYNPVKMTQKSCFLMAWVIELLVVFEAGWGKTMGPEPGSMTASVGDRGHREELWKTHAPPRPLVAPGFFLPQNQTMM